MEQEARSARQLEAARVSNLERMVSRNQSLYVFIYLFKKNYPLFILKFYLFIYLHWLIDWLIYLFIRLFVYLFIYFGLKIQNMVSSITKKY